MKRTPDQSSTTFHALVKSADRLTASQEHPAESRLVNCLQCAVLAMEPGESYDLICLDDGIEWTGSRIAPDRAVFTISPNDAPGVEFAMTVTVDAEHLSGANDVDVLDLTNLGAVSLNDVRGIAESLLRPESLN